MALSSDEAGRFADLLKGHSDELVGFWTEEVAATLRGRLSRAELHRQTEELQRGFAGALEAGAPDVEAEAAGELRALLSDLSSSRARQGFTATETAASVFALKDRGAEGPGHRRTHRKRYVA